MRLAAELVLAILIASGLGCLSVEDNTASPPQYSSAAPQGFPIQAKASWGDLMSEPTVTTTVINLGTQTAFPVSYSVTMSNSAADPAQFKGVFSLYPTEARLYTGCGFRVQHTAHSVFASLFNKTASATADIAGNEFAEHTTIGSDWGAITVVFPTGGGSINTAAIETSGGISLRNGYSQPLTINRIDILCGNQACDALPDPWVGAISAPSNPVDLACGTWLPVNFQCDPEKGARQAPATVAFTTSRGTVTTPFTCKHPASG